MFKAFYSKQLTNNKHIILGSREKQRLLFSLVHLILCYKDLADDIYLWNTLPPPLGDSI